MDDLNGFYGLINPYTYFTKKMSYNSGFFVVVVVVVVVMLTKKAIKEGLL